jgi:hypothetical protein
MLDPIQYEFRFFFTTLADPEPEPKIRYSGSGSGSTTLPMGTVQNELSLDSFGVFRWRHHVVFSSKFSKYSLVMLGCQNQHALVFFVYNAVFPYADPVMD